MRVPASSVRLRLTFWYTLVLGLIVLAFSLSVYLFVKGRLFQQLDRQLDKDFSVIDVDVSEESGEVADFEPEGTTMLFRLVKDKSLYYQSQPYARSGIPEPAAAPGKKHLTVRAASGKRFRLMTGPTKGGLLLTVAEDEEAARNALETLLIIFVLALPSALVLAAWGGHIMAGRLLQPVASMAEKAEKIGAENLSARLPVENPRDEFGRLATAFNQTLTRLQDAFERLRRFTADASHELRNPLTAIQSVGEVALQGDADVEVCRDSIGSMLEETARLTHLVDSLLLLTRTDSGRLQVRPREHDLTRLVEKAIEDLRVMAEEKGQKLVANLAHVVRATVDEETVRRALVNILDNAIKYTPPGGTISVGLKEAGGAAVIEVTDTGPGIPAEHQPRIFDRFYRIEKDRSGEDAGVGLGLAIARWAAEANGGRIELESKEGHGSTFRIVLPR